MAQIAIVVHDIEEAGRRYAALFGLEPPTPMITEPGNQVNMTYRGSPSNAQTKLAFLQLDNLQLELIEPLGGESVWQEALDARGEHVQHIAFCVDGMERIASFLSNQNIPMVQRGDMGPGQYAYFDGQEQIGLTLELLERERASNS